MAHDSPSGTSITDDDRKAGNATIPIPEDGAAQNEDGTDGKPKEGEDGSLKSYFVSDTFSPRRLQWLLTNLFNSFRGSSVTPIASAGGHTQRLCLA